jgi:lysophospholipase L1-like esterase
MRILFQGDSITDAGRDYNDPHNLGNGYPKYASALIKEAHPEMELEFFNFGISGNRTSQLFDRLYKDALAFDPDVISILIGINDVWHRHNSNRIATSDAQIELNYRSILDRIRKESHAKILIMAPFILDAEVPEGMRDELDRILPVIRKLADEFADVYIPLDEIFTEALKIQPEPFYYSKDGVHPNENGREFIGKLYAEAIKPIINSL